ncbi:MAG: hypothetical protein ACRDLV_09770 [Solirubrobacteraceae bacterium]
MNRVLIEARSIVDPAFAAGRQVGWSEGAGAVLVAGVFALAFLARKSPTKEHHP